MGTQQPVILCSYGYDPLDRLISQLQPDAPAHQRFYCKSRLATEIQGAIGFSVFQNNDLLLAQHKNQGGAVESTLLATDQQRSVLHTFTADQQQHPIAYSPYGHRQAESGLTSLLGFNGERPDPVTGHYLLGNGYRAFNPVLMRFNSPDNLSPFRAGGLNQYMYCLGDPINQIDPNGHIPFELKPVNNSSILLRRAKAKEILMPGSGKLPVPPKDPLTYQEIIDISDVIDIKNTFTSINNSLNKLILNDYKNYKTQNLKSTSAAVSRHQPPTNKQPNSLKTVFKIPPIPQDAGALLEYLNSASNPPYNRPPIEALIRAKSSQSHISIGELYTPKESVKAYYERVSLSVFELREATMNKHEKIINRLRGRK